MTTITNHQIIMDTITKSSQSPNHHHLHHLMVEVVEVWLGLSCDVGCRQPGARAFEKLYDFCSVCELRSRQLKALTRECMMPLQKYTVLQA